MVCGDDGKKFKTRSGDVVKLIDLLNTARDRMGDSLRQRATESKTHTSLQVNKSVFMCVCESFAVLSLRRAMIFTPGTLIF